ncbi:MAG: hypothetical protein ACJ765_08980 [Chloroflexota bacterium]
MPPIVVAPSPMKLPVQPGPYMGGFVPIELEPVIASDGLVEAAAVEPAPLDIVPPASLGPADPVRDGLFWTDLEG